MTARHQLHRIAHLAHLHLPASLLHQVDRAGPLESPWVAAGLGGLLAVRHRQRAGPPGGHAAMGRSTWACVTRGATR